MKKRTVKSSINNYISFREIGLLGFIVLVVIIVGMRNKEFVQFENIKNIVNDTSILAMLAAGMMLVIITGGIDLSVGSNIALCGMVSGLLVFNYPTLPVLLVLLISTLIGLFIGTITGLLVAKGNVLPIIASIGIMNISRAITFLISKGKWVTGYMMTDAFCNFTRDSFLGINSLIWLALIVYAIMFYFTNFTRSGRRIYAVGSNLEAAEVSGINVDRTKILVYSIMGAISGFCGMLWVSRYAAAQHDTATGYEMSVIASCVLGGVAISGGSGKILGVLIGAMLLGVINNALPMIQVSSFWKQTIQGLIILIAIIVNVLIVRYANKKNMIRLDNQNFSERSVEA